MENSDICQAIAAASLLVGDIHQTRALIRARFDKNNAAWLGLMPRLRHALRDDPLLLLEVERNNDEFQATIQQLGPEGRRITENEQEVIVLLLWLRRALAGDDVTDDPAQFAQRLRVEPVDRPRPIGEGFILLDEDVEDPRDGLLDTA